MSHKSM